MKTIIISDEYGIFCGMNGKYASFTKDALLCWPSVYGFNTEEIAKEFIERIPGGHGKTMKIHHVKSETNHISLEVLIDQGYGQHTGYMLDMLVPEDSTQH